MRCTHVLLWLALLQKRRSCVYSQNYYYQPEYQRQNTLQGQFINYDEVPQNEFTIYDEEQIDEEVVANEAAPVPVVITGKTQ